MATRAPIRFFCLLQKQFCVFRKNGAAAAAATGMTATATDRGRLRENRLITTVVPHALTTGFFSKVHHSLFLTKYSAEYLTE